MFMIVNLDTGERLPAGGTSAEFSRDKAPRLFRLKGHAVNALECWKAGMWYNKIDDYGDGEGPMPYESQTNFARAKQRQALNTAVVQVRLEVLA